MQKQTYLIMFALVTFCTAFALSSCTPNPAEQPNDNNSKGETTLPAGALSGLFSVNANGKQVRFSQGNLQYTQSTDTWSFAEQQYEILGEKNLTGATLDFDYSDGQYWSGTGLADKIDLFGWSGSTGSAKWGISTSKEDSDYTGDFVDWGRNPISNGGNKANQWRTLTYDEWHYLLSERRNCDELIGIAQVAGVNGLILLPDNFTLPSGLSFKSGLAADDDWSAYASYQSYTSADWFRMESAGAVFFSASSYRYGVGIYGLGGSGYYWSATPRGEDAGCLDFIPSEAGSGWLSLYVCLPVRLVQEVQ